jgi:hypothetical protein
MNYRHFQGPMVKKGHLRPQTENRGRGSNGVSDPITGEASGRPGQGMQVLDVGEMVADCIGDFR